VLVAQRNLGYRTIGAGGVRWFSSGYLPSLFDEFHYWGPADDATDKFAPRREEDFALSHARHIAERAGTAERFFLFINAAETHAPYGTCHGPVNVTTILRRWSSHWNGASPLPPGEEAATDMGLLHAAQISALETIDRRLGVLFDMLPGPLLIVICGDHGEAFGESAMWGHDMPAKVVMEVPLWIGTTESTTN
jgi:membrane-anchored protein YejM (alkaline phosphatase superfamily)